MFILDNPVGGDEHRILPLAKPNPTARERRDLTRTIVTHLRKAGIDCSFDEELWRRIN